MQIIKKLKSLINLSHITSLRWASKTLAVVISAIAGLALLYSLLLFAVMHIFNNLAFFLYMLVFLVVFIIIVALSVWFFPHLWYFIVKVLTSKDCKIAMFYSPLTLWIIVLLYSTGTDKPDHKEFALTLISSSIIMFILAIVQAITSRKRRRIFAVVGGFICIILLYAGIYNLVFIWRPLTFSFSQDIEEGVAFQRSFVEDLNKLRTLEHKLYLLTLIEGKPEVGFKAAQSHQKGDSLKHKITKSVEIEFIVVQDIPAGDKIHFIAHNNGKKVDFSVSNNWIQYPEHEQVLSLYYSGSVEDFHSRISELINTYQENIENLISDVELVFKGRPEWNTLDFCYFSAVTLTTLGYGDILPNSSLVRMIVMSQAIVGIVYAGFALALIRGE